MGLPGAGKTTLSRILAPRLNGVHLNADAVRANISNDLGFSEDDRIEQARRMGWLCDRIVEAGTFALADFICPTRATRAAFMAGGQAFIVWVDRVKTTTYADTDSMFVPPDCCDVRVGPEGSPDYWAEQIALKVRPIFDAKRPTALFIGRYQPFHQGHKQLILEGVRRVGQVCVAVRDTAGTDSRNPYCFEYVRARIEHALREHDGRYLIVPLPNITNVFYGREVGYTVERIELDKHVEAISASALRARLASAGGLPR